jgi:hypothetical protein
MNDTSTTTPALTPEEELHWTNLCNKHGIPPEQRELFRRILQTRWPNRYGPKQPVQRSAPEVLEVATAKIPGVIRDLPPDQAITVATMMRQVGLDPTNRADAAWIRRFLRESEQLTRVPPTRPKFVRRIGSDN